MIMKFGEPVIFGLPENPPTLPEGWRGIYDKREFAKAISPDGQEWWVGEMHVWPLRRSTPDDVAKGFFTESGLSFMRREERIGIDKL
jgi:hypothetical protein